MPIVDVQRRGKQIGRLRIGQQVPIIKDGKDTGKTRPARLDTFRFTTSSRATADAVARLYGGTIRDWNGEFEVITRESAIGVTVPPRDAVITQWYEKWSAGGNQLRCSGRQQGNGSACECPHASDPDDEAEVARCALDRARLAKMNPPQACSLITRISVMIPDLPGLGIWRLDTSSYYAATEIGDSAALLQMARGKGIFLPAMLRIEQRQRVANGQTRKYPVPVLEVLATFREIATGALEAGGITAQLPPPPHEQPKAITVGPPAPHRKSAGPATAPSPDDGEQPDPWQRAEAIYQAAAASQSRREFTGHRQQAKQQNLLSEPVRTDPAKDIWTPLDEALTELLEVRTRESRVGLGAQKASASQASQSHARREQ